MFVTLLLQLDYLIAKMMLPRDDDDDSSDNFYSSSNLQNYEPSQNTGGLSKAELRKVNNILMFLFLISQKYFSLIIYNAIIILKPLEIFIINLIYTYFVCIH